MPNKKFPSYSHHKPSNRGRIRLDGKDIYLDGAYNSEESLDHYDQLKTEWLRKQSNPSKVQLTIADVALLYVKFAQSYYVKDSKPTSEVESIQAALRLLVKFHRRTRACTFGPLKFTEFRDALIDEPDRRFKGKNRKLSRQYINKTIRRIVRMFKWAASREYVPSKIWHDLRSVEGLKKGRCGARETRKIKPVPDSDLEAILPMLSPPVAAMVNLQRATGMRPGEVVQMRPCDVTRRTDGLWAYRPPRWKTEHHNDDTERVIFLGPRTQEVLAPWLERDAESPCFSPCEAVAWLQDQKRMKRKTPVQPSQRDRSKKKPKRQPGNQYSEESYRQAIHYACDRAGVPKWSPNQIRHSVGTIVREKFGLESAQVVLGHARADVTETYAEANRQKAAEIAKQIG